MGVAETAEMGGAISSVAGENRSRPLSRSVSRRSQTVRKPWECKFVEECYFSVSVICGAL